MGGVSNSNLALKYKAKIYLKQTHLQAFLKGCLRGCYIFIHTITTCAQFGGGGGPVAFIYSDIRCRKKMNVINCRVDIKAGCYTSCFFFMFSHTSTTNILKNHGTQRWRIIREDPFWSEKDGGYTSNFVSFHNSNTLSHTWCTLYMYVCAKLKKNKKTYLLLWLRQAWQFKKILPLRNECE